MSWARIVGAQIFKILDYRRGDLNSAPLELAVPGDMRSGQRLRAGTQRPRGLPRPTPGGLILSLSPSEI